MSESVRRVQFVISGPFLLLLLLAAGFMTAGFWLYTHQPPPPKPQYPAYYVNRTLTAVRPCYQCVGTGGLKDSQQWKLAKTVEIPAGEQWWFAPVEDPPVPAKVDGIPMLAVHPAKDNQKPWEGFDEHRVVLVVLQDVDGRFAIEHPATPPQVAPPPAPADSSPPSDPPPSTTATQQ